ncbi:MAG TPA: hypothetical protein VIR01_06780, partial [Pyrinomonadaceae bacterium]
EQPRLVKIPPCRRHKSDRLFCLYTGRQNQAEDCDEKVNASLNDAHPNNSKNSHVNLPSRVQAAI